MSYIVQQKQSLVTFELCGISYFHSFVSRHDDSCLKLMMISIHNTIIIRFTLFPCKQKSKKSYIYSMECPQSITITSGLCNPYIGARNADSVYLWRKHVYYWTRQQFYRLLITSEWQFKSPFQLNVSYLLFLSFGKFEKFIFLNQYFEMKIRPCMNASAILISRYFVFAFGTRTQPENSFYFHLWFLFDE